ncbi:MAG: M28 family peptidase [Chloroflexota bacterium]
MKSSTTPIPVQASERIQFVDVLRGFAIFGILLFNMGSFAGRSFALRDWNEPLDQAIILLIDFFVQAKFYSLFSFLFGWGMAVQLRRARAKGNNIIPIFLRRLIILLFFGVLHSIFLWNGDILFMYALLGIPLLLIFRNRTEKTLLIASGVSLLISIVLLLPGDFISSVRTWCSSTMDCFQPENPLPKSLFATGSYFKITQLRFQGFINALWWFPCYFGSVFAMFLLGLYTGKRNIFKNYQQHIPFIKKVMLYGFGIGIIFNSIFVYMSIKQISSPQFAPLIRVGSRIIGAPALSLSYIAGIILLYQKEKWMERLAPLACVGRMALSNYIFHSVLFTSIFYGYGLGLYGETDPSFGLLLTLGVFLFQIRFSQWWFERYRFGPLEWLWRSLTYLNRQPLSIRKTYQDLSTSADTSARKPYFRLIIAWIIILIWAGSLWIWKDRIDTKIIQSPLEFMLRGTPSVDLGINNGESIITQASGPISTPVVDPVNYDPSLAAESGNMWELSSAFDVNAAFNTISYLSDSTFDGRKAGSAGGLAAGDYLSKQFARFGLQPAGDYGSFFQSFPITLTQLETIPTLKIEGADGTISDSYTLYQDFSPFIGAYSGAGSAQGQVVWVNDCKQDDFNKIDAVGKIVFCRMGELRDIGRNAIENGASGLLLLANPEETPPDYTVAFLPIWVPEPLPSLRVYPEVAKKLLRGSGISIPDLSTIFSPFELQTKIQMSVSTTTASACPSAICQGRNILGVIPGWDPAYKDQVLIIGANYDHLGSSPDNTTWVGANDNASGVSVLLEIARNWQAQGYVPRATTLFAIWDAKELGMLGSQFYVDHPRYPLENTIAVLQLDKVGAGEDTLIIDGSVSASEQIAIAAHDFDLQVNATNNLISDHSSFINANLPAHLFTWEGKNLLSSYNQRPDDKPEYISLDKLGSAGKFIEFTALSIIEGKSAIEHLLSQRISAFDNNDLGAFLATSTNEQQTADSFWYKEAQSLSPIKLELTADNLSVFKNSAVADVSIKLEIPSETQSSNDNAPTRWISAVTPIKFVYANSRWQWAGADLIEVLSPDSPGDINQENSSLPSFTITHPAKKSDGLDGLAQFAAVEYLSNTNLLGLTPAINNSIQLLSSNEILRANTTLTLPKNQSLWTEPRLLKLTYSPDILTGHRLTTGLAQLILANAGIEKNAAPWLWEGLPLVLRAEKDPTYIQSQLLPELQLALLSEENAIEPGEAASWAAVDYLRHRLDWYGLGSFIIDLGKACQSGHCQTDNAINSILSKTIQLNGESFHDAWQQSWKIRLTNAQENLNHTLSIRSNSILQADLSMFLSTANTDMINLKAEESSWFSDLIAYNIQSFTLSGKPLAIYDNGNILASITMNYQLADITESWGQASIPLSIIFIPSTNGYLWSGPPMETLLGSHIQIRFPQGQNKLAHAILADAENLHAQLSGKLLITSSQLITINLYHDPNFYRKSITLSYPTTDWLSTHTAEHQSIKILLHPDHTASDYHPVIASNLIRQLLYQTGVESEWLLTGSSIYFAWPADFGANQMAAAEHLHALTRGIKNGDAFSLASFPQLHKLSSEDYDIALPQAWDSIRYLAENYGTESLINIILAQSRGQSLDTAMRNNLGLSTESFEKNWLESYARGHALPSLVDISLDFDPTQVQHHISSLTTPLTNGRQAGSPGAKIAASYIKSQFENYGLTTTVQNFPISYRTYLETPLFNFKDSNGESIINFEHRRDFLVLQNSTSPSLITGELIWIADENYTNMDLNGKIAVRAPSHPIDEEIALATEHGASALIIVGDKNKQSDLLAKFPTPTTVPQNAIPVLELSRYGYAQLLELTGHTKVSITNTPPAIVLEAKVEIKTYLSDLASSETSNVIGMLLGSDPELSQQFIILGAHYDHVGNDPDYSYSGANDDASGIGVMLEIARLWQTSGYRPKRSVIFIAWGAQEQGELGSNFYIENPVYPLDKTTAMLQLDAVGGGEGYHLEAQGNRKRDGLLLFAIQHSKTLVDGRLQISTPDKNITTSTEWLYSPSALYDRARIGSKSDQAPFRNAGLQTLLLLWRGASEENLADTIADEINPDRIYITGKMVTNTLMMLAR